MRSDTTRLSNERQGPPMNRIDPAECVVFILVGLIFVMLLAMAVV